MKRYLILSFLSVLILGFVRVFPAVAQSGTNPESEFQRIRDIAFSGDYSNAAAEARKLVNRYPSYGDARPGKKITLMPLP